MNLGSIDSSSIANVPSVLILLLRSTPRLIQSPAVVIPLAILVALYTLHLAKGLITQPTLTHSTVLRPSRGAWLIPVLIVSVVIGKVIMFVK